MRGRKPELRPTAKAVANVPAPPSWFSKDAKAEWRRIMPALIERRILTEPDFGMVEAYCVSIGRVREIERQIQKSGEITPPLFRMQDKATQTARQIAAELGLTPVSRSRPTIRDDEGADGDLSFLD